MAAVRLKGERLTLPYCRGWKQRGSVKLPEFLDALGGRNRALYISAEGIKGSCFLPKELLGGISSTKYLAM